MRYAPRSITLAALAQRLGGSLAPRDVGQGDAVLTGVASLDKAGPGQVGFLTKDEYRPYLKACRAGAVIIREFAPDCPSPQILVPNPYLGFAKASLLFHEPDHGAPGVDPRAFVAASAQLGPDVKVFPFAYVGEGARIGARSVLYPGAFVGEGSSVGDDCVLHPNVVLYAGVHVGHRNILHAGAVIGADGFGFALGPGEVVKIPQVGTVRLADDVECGAHVTVDRAALGETVVGAHTKFDDKVHVGHNAVIGERCVFAAQFSIAGSSRIGNDVMAGGLSGVAGHLSVADKTKIGAMTGVITNTEEGESYFGFPATPGGQWRRAQVHVKRLPETEKSVKELLKRVAALEEKLGRGDGDA